MLSHLTYSFMHEASCPTQGWVTKQQMAALLGVTVQHLDRRYRPAYALPDLACEDGNMREVDGRLMFRAFDIFDAMNHDGLFERRHGVRLQSIVCPECGRTIGAKPPTRSSA